ncbi:OB-fold domain-containing protein [Pseudohoeflea coraliihabitans]|uniref:OB-fold domain-containing protein n=1 Tax=Pseudohoeflea coraliihabitans TaxID=2860393 RepID=A0ABS6WIN2_9HYPH|nr:OB-fold domain-containing protein [Pseudohoeflea sp. DP4N28-3]MBW3095809.1 OB-fold domain-containing protein [Pseudohoeflea sp. DP4N28-3]
MIGITGFGAYVPRLRLTRQQIADGQPGGARGKTIAGERAICNWDEDAITLAVEAARDCLQERNCLTGITLASTTAPFADRQNAGIVAAALDLDEDLQSMDVGGAQRAGTTALITALRSGCEGGERLVVASEHRVTRAGAPHEVRFGDGAAALSIGATDVIAELRAAETRTVDFVDHFRAADAAQDYYWEERWIRDEGVMKIVPPVVEAALAQADMAAGDIDHVILPSPVPGVGARLAAQLEFQEAALAETFDKTIGDTGAAHPLLRLAAVLSRARAGEKILLAAFGQGTDVLILETTAAIGTRQPRLGVTGALAQRRPISDYAKYLSFAGLIDRELGMRAEGDNKTALTQLYRRRDLILGLVGGECEKCGTRQLPRSRYCVNPKCNALDTQKPFAFADVPARVLTWSADHLSFTPDPPSYYGLIAFEGGGRMFANFAEVDAGAVDVGSVMRMAFRVKEHDRKRNFRRYFWKAVPDGGSQGKEQ